MSNSCRQFNIKNCLLAVAGAFIISCLMSSQFFHDKNGYVLSACPHANIFISDISPDWTSLSVGFYVPTEHCHSCDVVMPKLKYDVGHVGMDSAPVFRLSDKDSLWHNIDNLNNLLPENVLDGLVLYPFENLREKHYEISSEHVSVCDIFSGANYSNNIDDCDSGNYIITKSPVGLMSVPQSNLLKDDMLLKNICHDNEDDKWLIVTNKNLDTKNYKQ